jgi:putative ABC transport system substrate-binding protein
MKLKTKTLVLFLASLLVTFAMSGCSNPEQNKTYKIGVVNPSPAFNQALDGFKTGMEEAGYVEGKNVTYIYDGPAANSEAITGVLENLKNEEVDLVLTFGTVATSEAQKTLAGTGIPIVFGPVTDPVASGIVTSALNPGGNITGIMTGNPAPKRLEWLLKIDPEIKRLYTFNNPEDNSSVQSLAALKEAASVLNVELVIRDTTTAEEITAALNAIPEDIDAIIFTASGFFERNLNLFVEFANQQNLPLSASASQNVRDGALTSYGHDNVPLGQQAARLAVQILSGIKPADLPVESAELFLAINLKTSNIIGLSIAEEVIEAADIVIR